MGGQGTSLIVAQVGSETSNVSLFPPATEAHPHFTKVPSMCAGLYGEETKAQILLCLSETDRLCWG